MKKRCNRDIQKQITRLAFSMVVVFLLSSILNNVGLKAPVDSMHSSYAQVKARTVKATKVQVPVLYKGFITTPSEFCFKEPFSVSIIIVNESAHSSEEIEVPIKSSKKPTGFTFEISDLKASYSFEMKVYLNGNPVVAQALVNKQYLGKNGMTTQYENRRFVKGESLNNIKLNINVDPAVARETKRFLKTYIQADMSKREKVEALYDGIASEMPYSDELLEQITSKTKTKSTYKINPLVDALVDKRAVCGGHANTMKWMLDQLGIDNYLANGKAEDGIGHVWNMVQTDKGYYGVDITIQAGLDKIPKQLMFEQSRNWTNLSSDQGLFFLEGFMTENGISGIDHDIKVRNDGTDRTLWRPYDRYFETHPALERKLVKITGQIQLPQETNSGIMANLSLKLTSLESKKQIEDTFSTVSILKPSNKENKVTFEAMVPSTKNGYKYLVLKRTATDTYATSGIVELSETGAHLNLTLQPLKKQAVVVKRPKWIPEELPCTINIYAKILPSEKLVSLNDSRGGITVKFEPHQKEGYATLDAIESDQYLYLIAEYVSDTEKRRYYYTSQGWWTIDSNQMMGFDFKNNIESDVIMVVLD